MLTSYDVTHSVKDASSGDTSSYGQKVGQVGGVRGRVDVWDRDNSERTVVVEKSLRGIVS